MEQVNIVFKTSDYNLFKETEGNRRLNENNVKRLKKSMQSELLQVPIIVNERYEVIDGQHRLKACKELSYPIYYIIVNGYGLNQVHQLNIIGKKWSFFDYLDGYADKGLESYKEARDFYRKYGLGSLETMGLLLGYSSLAGMNDRDKFVRGEFKIKDLKDARRKADMITSIKQYYIGYNRRNFVAALMKLFTHKDFDFPIFFQKLSYQSTELVDCTSVNAYIYLIEKIYNHKNREKVRFI